MPTTNLTKILRQLRRPVLSAYMDTVLLVSRQHLVLLRNFIYFRQVENNMAEKNGDLTGQGLPSLMAFVSPIPSLSNT